MFFSYSSASQQPFSFLPPPPMREPLNEFFMSVVLHTYDKLQRSEKLITGGKFQLLLNYCNGNEFIENLYTHTHARTRTHARARARAHTQTTVTELTLQEKIAAFFRSFFYYLNVFKTKKYQIRIKFT